MAARAFAPARRAARSRTPMVIQAGGVWHRIVALDLGADLAHVACGEVIPRGRPTALGPDTCPTCIARRPA